MSCFCCFFLPGGVGCKPAACPRAPPAAPLRPGAQGCGISARLFPPLRHHFPRCFLVVMMLAQRLQVAFVGKPRPIAAVRDDVVSHRCPRAHPLLCTLAAERFPQKLLRPKPVRPHRQTIPAVVLRAFAALFPWPVLWAPAVPRQLSASRILARPQRPVCHPFHPRETKKPELTTPKDC